MTRLLKNLWTRFLFQDRGVLPARRLLVIFLIFSVMVIAAFTFSGISWTFVFIVNGIFLLISLLDLLVVPKKSQLTISRDILNEMERNNTYTVKINIENRSSRGVKIRLKDDVPRTFHAVFPLHGYTERQRSDTFSYEIIPTERGKYEIEKLYIRFRSILGLWEKQMVTKTADTVKVIPDLTETKHYLENAQRFLLAEGEKIRRQHSGSGEFSRIRSYVIGDDPRKINWRQTAKLQEVMTNEYEPEHGKNITILIDCGRMMGAELKHGNRLEKVLEAAMTTAAAALKNEDYVGVLAFSKNVKVFIPPAKGMDQLQKILQAVYNLDVDAYESNYQAVISYLQTVQKKRSLILLFSDVQTFLHEESALIYLKRLRQRHLFLMIGIQDEELALQTKQEPTTVKRAMVKSIAGQQIQQKKQKKVKWEAQGLLMAEAKEERLATAAVSHYIQIMNQGLL